MLHIFLNFSIEGRYQILSGIRRLDIKYEGDPALRPICTYEVACLVRKLHLLSNYLNNKVNLKKIKWFDDSKSVFFFKYKNEIVNWFYRRDLLGSIARVILNPPTTIYEYHKSINDSPHKRVPKDLPPRIDLRIIANKRVSERKVFINKIFILTLFQILIPLLLLFFLCYLMNVSSMKISFYFLVPFVIAYILGKALTSSLSATPTHLHIRRTSTS